MSGTPTPLPRVATLSSTATSPRKPGANVVPISPLASGKMKPIPRIATLKPRQPPIQPVQKQFPRGVITRNEFGEYEYVDSDGGIIVDKLLHQLEEVVRQLKLLSLRDEAFDEVNEEKAEASAGADAMEAGESKTPSPQASSSEAEQEEASQRPPVPTPRLVVLTLSGAFAPVNVAHLAMFDAAKSVLEREHGCTVIAGFMALSGDAYMRTKVRIERQYMPLEERAKLCKLACQNSSYVDVCAYGWTSSDRVAEKLKFIVSTIINETETLATYLASAPLEVIQLCGSNTALKNKLYTRGTHLAISRSHSMQRLVADVAAARSKQEAGGPAHRFMIVDTEDEGYIAAGHPPVPQVSSSDIRELLFAGDKPRWADLQENEWLHPAVLLSLKEAFQRFGWLCRT